MEKRETVRKGAVEEDVDWDEGWRVRGGKEWSGMGGWEGRLSVMYSWTDL